MDLSTLLGIIRELGLPVTMIMALLVILYNSVKTVQGVEKAIDKNTDALLKLQSAVGNTYLDLDKAVIVFESILNEHINKKLAVIGELLENNHLVKREMEIKKRIKTEFQSITEKEANKLSKFRTSAGDMGAILCETLDWDKFLGEVYEIIFNDNYDNIIPYVENVNLDTRILKQRKNDIIKLKIKDLKSLMINYVTEIIREIKRRGDTNE